MLKLKFKKSDLEQAAEYPVGTLPIKLWHQPQQIVKANTNYIFKNTWAGDIK